MSRIKESRGESGNGFSIIILNNSSPGNKYCFSHCLCRKKEFQTENLIDILNTVGRTGREKGRKWAYLEA